MAGLIPLMLASSTRNNYIGSSQSCHSRRSSSASSLGSPGLPPTSPTFSQYPRQRLSKRISLPPPPLTDAVPTIPVTVTEWKQTIAQVKRQYFSKRYRACSARCLEVLEGVKDMPDVEPVYLIYLHFYAATSMEICARALPSTSALRTTLLQQARTHFDRASSLISSAEESIIRKARSGSAMSSRASSSCHSPSSSVSSSRAWTPDTQVSSPTESICSCDEKNSSRKRSKKVSFSLPRQQQQQQQNIQEPEPESETSYPVTPEPMVRPDSPTLGFDDSYFQAGAARQKLPEIPLSPKKFHEVELPLQQPQQQSPHQQLQSYTSQFTITPIPEEDEPEEEHNHHHHHHQQQQQQQQQQQHHRNQQHYDHEEDEDDDYSPPPSPTVARSVDRACEHLASLRSQLVRHAASLDELLSYSVQRMSMMGSSPSPAPASPTIPEFRPPVNIAGSSTTSSGPVRLPSMHRRAQSSTAMATMMHQGHNPLSREGARSADLQARIEKLRRCGWQRKRFDASRYEELCEAVMAELS
ncbi:uncharacterized protein CTHT_0057780 [Thermochaetoides thermophila DSM 1495]|uniref:Uncharacterized protein n=1 Tax=Chaetomium thermophilum (strain DSM 1495 / CBS 144.50 / IMI 039719) TaxID=759272 RepID=G0SCM7_CHATD|nr:hypothetical protein CTHT_0057780 [Thermochaetoides thermophila DSM 1495]EGS19153.1 hypothetical protein CTHT_0057780 [Thermochaetoides thermophila DSM 1495]